MKNDYKHIKPMKEVPEQLRKLRRQFLRYQQAEIVYSLSHKKLFELARDAGAMLGRLRRQSILSGRLCGQHKTMMLHLLIRK